MEEKFLLFTNHPIEGMRFKTAHDSEDAAVEAAQASVDDNIPEGRSPEEYEHIVLQGLIVSPGPDNA